MGNTKCCHKMPMDPLIDIFSSEENKVYIYRKCRENNISNQDQSEKLSQNNLSYKTNDPQTQRIFNKQSTLSEGHVIDDFDSANSEIFNFSIEEPRSPWTF